MLAESELDACSTKTFAEIQALISSQLELIEREWEFPEDSADSCRLEARGETAAARAHPLAIRPPPLCAQTGCRFIGRCRDASRAAELSEYAAVDCSPVSTQKRPSATPCTTKASAASFRDFEEAAELESERSRRDPTVLVYCEEAPAALDPADVSMDRVHSSGSTREPSPDSSLNSFQSLSFRSCSPPSSPPSGARWPPSSVVDMAPVVTDERPLPSETSRVQFVPLPPEKVLPVAGPPHTFAPALGPWPEVQHLVGVKASSCRDRHVATARARVHAPADAAEEHEAQLDSVEHRGRPIATAGPAPQAEHPSPMEPQDAVASAADISPRLPPTAPRAPFGPRAAVAARVRQVQLPSGLPPPGRRPSCSTQAVAELAPQVEPQVVQEPPVFNYVAARPMPDGMVDPVDLLMDDLMECYLAQVAPCEDASRCCLGADVAEGMEFDIDRHQTFRPLSVGDGVVAPRRPVGQQRPGSGRSRMRSENFEVLPTCSGAAAAAAVPGRRLASRGERNWRGVHRPADSTIVLASRGRRDLGDIAVVSTPRSPSRPPSAGGSTGPSRGLDLGCAPGLSTQYSCRAEEWWQKSHGVSKTRPRPASSILGSQHPRGAMETNGAAPLSVPGWHHQPAGHWPAGLLPHSAADLPPLQGAEFGQSDSLGLSIAPPPPVPKTPSWLHKAS